LTTSGFKGGVQDYSGSGATHQLGRFPANLIHDGSEEAVLGMGESSRYFYCAKASKADRSEGNHHPTVKPTDLMRYLCRLVTQPGGIVLGPFTGSGSTGKAAILEGFQFIGIEREAEYVEIARARIEHAIKTKPNTLDL
jgi:site-specific DNA-methyltransferase (adenine-specific)